MLIQCPDRPGIVAAVGTFLFHRKANITSLHEYCSQAEGSGEFFMRLEFQLPQAGFSRAVLERAFEEEVADRFGMRWSLTLESDVKKMVILVSRHDHALLELLWRVDRGELPAEVTMVISNHSDLEGGVGRFGIPYHHVPMEKGAKERGEKRMLELLGDAVDVIVLARYMQILSPAFVGRYPNCIINIHHSFLPAFVGADPYRRAYERGVKLIGATAHYVTDELDTGPIIDQDVVRVNHRQGPGALKRLGRDVERSVLARAVHWHLEDRVLVHENRTVIFV